MSMQFQYGTGLRRQQQSRWNSNGFDTWNAGRATQFGKCVVKTSKSICTSKTLDFLLIDHHIRFKIGLHFVFEIISRHISILLNSGVGTIRLERSSNDEQLFIQLFVEERVKALYIFLHFHLVNIVLAFCHCRLWKWLLLEFQFFVWLFFSRPN